MHAACHDCSHVRVHCQPSHATMADIQQCSSPSAIQQCAAHLGDLLLGSLLCIFCRWCRKKCQEVRDAATPACIAQISRSPASDGTAHRRRVGCWRAPGGWAAGRARGAPRRPSGPPRRWAGALGGPAHGWSLQGTAMSGERLLGMLCGVGGLMGARSACDALQAPSQLELASRSLHVRAPCTTGRR